MPTPHATESFRDDRVSHVSPSCSGDRRPLGTAAITIAADPSVLDVDLAGESVFNDHLKASAHETTDQLTAQADKLRASITKGASELGEDMKETSKLLAKRASDLRTAVAANIDNARIKHDADKQSVKTMRDAEVAEAYAAATHFDAVHAVAESEQAAMEALAARSAADTLTAAAKN